MKLGGSSAKLLKVTVSIFMLCVVSVIGVLHWQDRYGTGNLYCQDNGKSKPYCQYEGRISGLYLNDEGLLLVSLASPFVPEHLSAIGLDSANVSMMHVAMSTKTAAPADTATIQTMQQWLTHAYRDKRTVKVHLRGTHEGYMIIDRIWW